ncbi:MAG TPA: hypothetical protein DCX54_05780 [Flavobacteriales bacterium]|nr:hypothetical protein [Flavobacteriales bacterium]
MLVLLLASCAKDDNQELATIKDGPTTASIDGMEGFFNSVKEVRHVSPPMGPIRIDNGTNVWFYKFPMPYSNAFIDVGDVFCNGLKLQKSGIPWTRVYVADSGLVFNQNLTWTVTGGSGVQPFTHVSTMGFPYVSELICPDTIVSGQPCTVSVDTLTNADSVEFWFGNAKFHAPGNVMSHTFSTAEVDSVVLNVPPGAVYTVRIPIYTYRHSGFIINGRKYYFRNVTFRTRDVSMRR